MSEEIVSIVRTIFSQILANEDELRLIIDTSLRQPQDIYDITLEIYLLILRYELAIAGETGKRILFLQVTVCCFVSPTFVEAERRFHPPLLIMYQV